ncbi:hypothetical protein CYMTET_50735, partial [Cymbomonas tetramitiformis]
EKEVAVRRQEALKAHREAFQPIDRNEILEHERKYKEALVEVQRKKHLLEEQKQLEHEEELHRRMHAAGGADQARHHLPEGQGVRPLCNHSEDEGGALDEGGPLEEYPMLSGVSPTAAVDRSWTAREDLEVRQSLVGRYSDYGEHNARYSQQVSESANESDAAPPGESDPPAPRRQPAQLPPEAGKPAGKRKKRFRGKAMAKVIEQDWMRKEEQLSRKAELKQRRAKQKNYANMVKELYLPPVDLDLQEELEERVEKNKPVKLPPLKKEEQRRKYKVRDLFADRRVQLQRGAEDGDELLRMRMEASARVSAVPADERWAEKSAHAKEIEVQGAADGRVPLLPDIDLGRHTSHGPISSKQRDLLEPLSEALGSDAKSDPGPPKPKRVAMAEDKEPRGPKAQESRTVRRQKAAHAAEGRARQSQGDSIAEGAKSRKTRKSPRVRPLRENGDILLPSLLAAGTSAEAADLVHKAHESELRAKKVAASVSMSSDVMGEIELDQKASELYVDAIKNKLAAFTAPFDGYD